MNHSQKLESNVDEIKGIIEDLKGKDKQEIEAQLANQMKVSLKTAQRYYKRFKPIEYPHFEIGEYKKDSACKILRGVNDAIEEIEIMKDTKEKLELFDKAATIISKVKTY
tara:strand:+ start:1047 stop:1376 length:330 start_codon:yes stop_codon:yes gene_type:complete